MCWKTSVKLLNDCFSFSANRHSGQQGLFTASADGKNRPTRILRLIGKLVDSINDRYPIKYGDGDGRATQATHHVEVEEELK